jgi:hypothetical protein
MRQFSNSDPSADDKSTGEVDIAKSLAKALAEKTPATQPDSPFTFGESNREH